MKDYPDPQRRWYFGPLPGDDRESINDRVLQHIKQFFGPLKLEFPFQIDCKEKNSEYVQPVAGYVNKADYAIRDATGKTHFKVRGEKDEPGLIRHRKLEILQAIVEGREDAVDWSNGGVSDHVSILKVSSYLKNGQFGPNDSLPGDSIKRTRIAHITDTHLHYDTIENFRKAKLMVNKTINGLRVAQHEKIAVNNRLDYRLVMANLRQKQDRLDDGKSLAGGPRPRTDISK